MIIRTLCKLGDATADRPEFHAALVNLLDMIYQEGIQPSQAVLDAFLERIRLHQSPAEAETNEFHLLRRWAPARLVDR
jgi:hypothetical protein